MGWLSRMGPFSAFLVTIALVSVVESTSFDCDLDSTTNVINVTAGATDSYFHLNVLNLKASPVKTSCTWNVTSQSIEFTFLEFSRVALAPGDNITVTGYQVSGDNAQSVKDTILYQSSGSPLPGLVSTSKYNYVIIELKVTPNATVNRSYSTVYYFKNSYIHLRQDSGLYSFLMNSNKANIKTNFAIQPDTEYADRVIMLNFTQLPKTFSLTLNGVTYNNTVPPAPFFLQSTSALNVTVDYTPAQQDDIFLARYWLVTASCSGVFSLVKIGDQKTLLHPNEADRQQQKLTTVRCAQYFTGPQGTKFQMMINPATNGLANSGDSVNVYAVDGTLELGLNNPALMYFRTIDNFLPGNRFLVMYDSPYDAVPNPKFNENDLSMRVVPESNGTLFMLSDKDVSATFKKDDKGPIVHLIYPLSLSDNKRVLVEFPPVTLTPGKLTISIFNTDAAESVQPIVTLGQYDLLPSVIASNSPIMRVVYSGDIQQLPSVTYRLVDQNSCQLLTTFAPTFEVVGGQSNQSCSWYIPESKTSNHTVINPTIVKIPKGKTLTVTTFSKDGSKSKVSTYQGPLKESYFPDMFWSPNNSYQFTLDSANVSKDDLHLLIAHKSNYLTETLNIPSTEKLASISSPNYPGYYPVGLTQNWMFMGNDTERAFITVRDVHLKDAHSLSIISQATHKTDFKGDVNLTGFPDYLVTYPFSVNLDAKAFNLTSYSNRGFKVDLLHPGIAENFTFKPKESSLINFNSTQNSVPAKPLNIWRVTADDGSSSLSDSILHIHVTLAESMDKTKASLKVYDSISLRPENVHYANASVNGTSISYLGSIKSALIVYDYSASLSTKTDFSVTISVTTEACSNTKNYTTKCHTTDRCITDAMVCNHIDDCGDYTDELYCNGAQPPPPTPPTPASGGGVNTLVVIFILMPMAAVLGIVGYIYLPQFLLRIRRGRYSEFRDLSEVS